MNRKPHTWAAWTAPFILAGGLTACGGGGGESPITPVGTVDNTPPATASATDAGLVAYTATVAETSPAAAPDDPVDLSSFTPPPKTEDGDPIATSADEGA